MVETLILTIDSLRQDCFSSSHFTNTWSTLQSEFAVFENNYANGVATPFSFPGIITGFPATGDGSLPPDNPTIAESYDGYSWGLSNNPHLRPERNYDRGFDFFQDDITELRGDNESNSKDHFLIQEIKKIGAKSSTLHRLYDRFLRSSSLSESQNRAEYVVDELKDAMGDKSGLFWGHFMDPHYKFHPKKIHDKDISVGHSEEEIWYMNKRFERGEADSDDLECLYKLYKEQIKYLDRQLDDFFTFLKSNNRWEDSLIIILSDHGEAFGEEDIYNHEWDADPVDVLVKVPLLIKWPQGKHAGEKFTHLTSNADVKATLTSVCDYDTNWPKETKPLSNTDPRVVVSKSNTAVRIITKNGSKIRRRDGSTETLWGSLNERAQSILEDEDIPQIETLIGNIPGNVAGNNVDERLEALGYK